MAPRALVNAGRRAGLRVLRGEEDARLVELAGHRSEPAFEAIVERYRAQLVRYAAVIVGPDGADETVQESLVRAHTALARGDQVDCLRPWLFRIVRNAALNQVRDGGPEARPLGDLDASMEGPELVAERSQGLRDILVALRTLPRRQRDAIVLRELEGRSYDEIADRLGVSDPAVRGLLHRARATLRRVVAGLGPLWPGRLAEIWVTTGAASPVPVRAGAAALLAAAATAGGVTAAHDGGGRAAGHAEHGAARASPLADDTALTAAAERVRVQRRSASVSAVDRGPRPPTPGRTPTRTSDERLQRSRHPPPRSPDREPRRRLEERPYDGSRDGPSPESESFGEDDIRYEQPRMAGYVGDDLSHAGSSDGSSPGSYGDDIVSVSSDSGSCLCDVNEPRSDDGP